MKKIEKIKNDDLINIIEKLKNELNNIFGIHLKKIILYGSYARNEEKLDSDIDIMVLTDMSKNDLIKYRDKITDLMVELSLEFDKIISITENNLFDFENFINYIPFYKNVNNEGVELYAG